MTTTEQPSNTVTDVDEGSATPVLAEGAPPEHSGHAEHPSAHPTATGVTSPKLAIWIFLASDCLFFGAFIAAYLLYRGHPNQKGPGPSEVFNIPFTSITSFIRRGLTIKTNLFGSSFFVLTGFHGVHVTLGILMLLSLVRLSQKGKLPQAKAEVVEIAGLYWHFVDIVWIVIFTVVYLMPGPK